MEKRNSFEDINKASTQKVEAYIFVGNGGARNIFLRKAKLNTIKFLNWLKNKQGPWPIFFNFIS